MTTLYLVRHGETEFNASNKVQGTMDTDLNEKGMQQAELVAKRLLKEEIDVTYTSSLNRAKSTAMKIADIANTDIYELHEFREICLGPWQGLTLDEINAQYAEHYKVYRENPSAFNMPGAETFLEVTDRFCGAIHKIVAENKDKKIVIVSHGAAIKAAIISILGMDINFYNKFRIDNASISVLLFNESYRGGVTVKCMNDTCHLRTE